MAFFKIKMSVDNTIFQKKHKTSIQMKMENLQKQDIKKENCIVSQPQFLLVSLCNKKYM